MGIGKQTEMWRTIRSGVRTVAVARCGTVTPPIGVAMIAMIQTQMRSPSPNWFMGWLAVIVLVILIYLAVTSAADRKEEEKHKRRRQR